MDFIQPQKNKLHRTAKKLHKYFWKSDAKKLKEEGIKKAFADF